MGHPEGSGFGWALLDLDFDGDRVVDPVVAEVFVTVGGLDVAVGVGGTGHEDLFAGSGSVPVELPTAPGVAAVRTEEAGVRPGLAFVGGDFDFGDRAPSRPGEALYKIGGRLGGRRRGGRVAGWWTLRPWW